MHSWCPRPCLSGSEVSESIKKMSVKRRYVVLLVMLASACGGTSSTPTTPSGPGGSSPTSGRLFNGLAATSTSDGVFGAIAATPSGERFGVMTERGAAGQIVKVVGATFVLSDGSSAVVYAGADGLPARAVFGEYVVLFSNYTSNTVDIAAVAADGTVSNVRAAPVDANKLANLRSLPAQLLSASATSSTRTLSVTTSDLQGFAFGLKLGGFFLSTLGCTGSIALLGTPAAPAAILMAAPCISWFVTALTLIDPSLDTPVLGESSGMLMSMTECLGLRDTNGCTSVIVTALSNITSATETIVSRPSPAPTPTPSPTPSPFPTPAVSATSVSSVAATSATISSSVNPNGAATNVSVQFGPTVAYGQTTSTQAAGSGTALVNISTTLGDLSPGTRYHARVTATSSGGTTSGEDVTFSTLGTPSGPSAATDSATNITANSAVLGGTVSSNGSSTNGLFQWGTTTGYGNTTDPQPIDSGASALAIAATVTGLAPATVYHYRVSATNAAGTSVGGDMTFTTAASSGAAPPTPAGPSPGSTASPGPTLADSNVTLNWGASPGATNYGLGVRDIASGVLVVDTYIAGTSYTATLTAGRQYRWNVSACNAAGCSSYTTVLYFQAPTTVTVPVTPTNPSPGATSSPGPTLSSSTVTFNWGASSGATNYGLGVRDIASGVLVVDTYIAGTAYTAVLTEGHQYRWNVSACGATGCSSYTTVLYFQTPTTVTVPVTPTNPSPGATSGPGPTLSSSTVTFNWGASSGATNYGLGVRDIASGVLRGRYLHRRHRVHRDTDGWPAVPLERQRLRCGWVFQLHNGPVLPNADYRDGARDTDKPQSRCDLQSWSNLEQQHGHVQLGRVERGDELWPGRSRHRERRAGGRYLHRRHRVHRDTDGWPAVPLECERLQCGGMLKLHDGAVLQDPLSPAQ